MLSVVQFRFSLSWAIVAGVLNAGQTLAESPDSPEPIRFQQSPVTIAPPSQQDSGTSFFFLHGRLRLDDGACIVRKETAEGDRQGLFWMGKGTFKVMLLPGEKLHLDPQGHSGEYSIRFEPVKVTQLKPVLVGSLSVAVLVDIAAPLLLAIFLVRRLGCYWRHWWYGMLVFLLFQGITRIPVMVYLQTRPVMKTALAEPVWLWSFLFFAALTAGLFEEGGRWLAFRLIIPPGEHRWRAALMLGAGHGGLESIGAGLVALVSLIAYLLMTLAPPAIFGQWAAQVEEAARFGSLQGWEPLLSGWERLGALAIQVALSVLVLQAFLRGRRWWWYALGAHTLVDFTVVGLLNLAQPHWGDQAGILIARGLLTVYALLALWLVLKLRPREQEDATPTPQ